MTVADLFYIPYVRAVWSRLADRLSESGRLYIFGAGEHTRWLLAVTDDLSAPPIECILDDRAPLDDVGGIKVRRPDDVNVQTGDLVLLSTDRWENELGERARSVFGDRIEIVRLYEALPPGPYDKNDDRADALTGVARVRSDHDSESRRIVFIADQPRGREWKLARALRSQEWEPVLLYHRTPTFNAPRHFAQAINFRTPWEALRLACDLNPTAYHVMVNSDYRLAEMFLQHRPGPVIVDSYDLIAGMYTDEFLATRPDLATERERERFCLENADGLCCRSRESDHVADTLQYEPARRIFFADGCVSTARAVPRAHDKNIHVVYVGKLIPEQRAGSSYCDEGRLLWLARALAEQEVHFHIYPGFELPTHEFDDAFADYRDLESQSSFFHFHRPVAADTLIEELARYDYGLFVYHEFVQPSETGFALTSAKLRLCTSNKFHDYLDAGLPIVHNAHSDSDLAAIAGDHGADVDLSGVPLEQWGATLRNQDRPALRKAAEVARAHHDLIRHAPRLIRFYESFGNGTAPSSSDENNWFEEHDHADHRSGHRPALV